MSTILKIKDGITFELETRNNDTILDITWGERGETSHVAWVPARKDGKRSGWLCWFGSTRVDISYSLLGKIHNTPEGRAWRDANAAVDAKIAARRRQIREWDLMHNDGGYGYNPYR